jgi:hypothetical protein
MTDPFDVTTRRLRVTDAPVVRERPGHPKVLARETGGAALDPAA